MVDNTRIYVKAGDGGSGCDSFKGIKFTSSRHPDGGSGGRGADVIIKVARNIQGLQQFQFKQQFRAEKGKNGQANKKKGADGRPSIIRVPPGTVIRDLKDNLLLGDLIEADEELVVAKGGAGGRANARKKPATAGLQGEQRHLSLELRLVADVGIVGYPNAGKSTFLAKITSARPKIASYPFTTSTPVLGVLEFPDFAEPSVLTIVELPPLTKGSHQGKGLGVDFLRHAERAKILLHLIDMAAQEGRDPRQDYQDLNLELKLYNQKMFDKPQILVANKMDRPEAKINLRNFSTQIKKNIYPISALNGRGVEELLDCLRNQLKLRIVR